MELYTQGSVIYGIRSQYSVDTKCYGIVITARCEIAQDKAKVIHILSALSLNDWIIEELFPRAASAYLNDLLRPIYEWAKLNMLDIDTLFEFGPSKVAINVEADKSLLSKKHDQLIAVLKEWGEWNRIVSTCTRETKISLLNGILSKKKAGLLTDLMTGHFPNDFCFLPQCARYIDGSKFDGIVVRLKDIIQLSPEDLKEIQRKGLDYSEIIAEPDGIHRLEHLKRHYFLLSHDDFVIMDQPIMSPWIEYLMQNFANSFTRIGVDGASPKEVSDFCKKHKL